MVFKAKMKTAGAFIKIIDALAGVVDILNIRASEKGLIARAIDPTHVAMVDLNLSKDIFADYECNSPITLRTNLVDLNPLMKRGAMSDELLIEHDEERNKLKVKFKHKKSTRTFTVSLIADDPSEETPPQPSVTLNVGFEIDSAALGQLVKDVDVIGSYVQVTYEDGKLLFGSQGDNGEVEIVLEDLLTPPKDVEGKHAAMYSVEFLKDILKGTALSDKVEIKFNNEMPIQLRFPIMDGLINYGDLTYFLAPRVEEEEVEPDEPDDDLELEDDF